MANTQPEELHEETSEDSTWSNAAKLSRKVRELAHRSYRVLKPGKQPEFPVQASPEDIAEDTPRPARSGRSAPAENPRAATGDPGPLG